MSCSTAYQQKYLKQLTSHLGDSGMKNRPKSCTRQGIVPEIKKENATYIATFVNFTLIDENHAYEHYLLEPKSSNLRTLQ